MLGVVENGILKTLIFIYFIIFFKLSALGKGCWFTFFVELFVPSWAMHTAGAVSRII